MASSSRIWQNVLVVPPRLTKSNPAESILADDAEEAEAFTALS